MPEIRTWANSVGQQIENMTVDLVATTAAGISEANGDVFFVGRPASNNAQEWILKKITPTELNKMVYNYLTSSAIANLLASALGGSLPFGGVDLSSIGAETDWNNVTFGIYRVQNVSGNNAPDAYNKGYLICFNRTDYGTQMYVECATSTPKVWIRSINKAIDGWGEWKFVALS